MSEAEYGMPVVDGSVGEPVKGRIAVLIEEHFDQSEFLKFNEFFPAHGYQVEYISNLWGNSNLVFRPNADDGVMKVAVRVSADFAAVTPERYLGIICIGAYAMDRLRYQTEVAPGQVNNAPAVAFLRKALARRGLKVGTICHSLWLLCADRKLLAGRRVTCAHNILCDVENAGGVVIYDEALKQTAAAVVDGDFVSARHPGVLDLFVATFLEEMERGAGGAFRVLSDDGRAAADTAETPAAAEKARGYQSFTNALTVMGRVRSIDPEAASVTVTARSGDEFRAFLGANTSLSVLQNLDGQSNDPYRNGPGAANPGADLARRVKPGQLLIVEGIQMEDGGDARFEARTIHLLYNGEDGLLFEQPHWWISQIQSLCNQLIGTMWGDADTFEFAKYRTNVRIDGAPSDDGLAEIETLGRLLYGFATTYLLTGNERYLDATRAGVAFQRQWFRNLSHDGRFVFWSSWKKGAASGMGSLNGDDAGSIAAYEQIYALAGITQFYRITLDPEALLDIRRTVASFERFFLDGSEFGGYFSHLDPSTMSADAPALGQNRSKKNWNSNGDHIPAYLVNLLLALKPLPRRSETEDLRAFVDRCEQILRRCATLIVEKFPDPDAAVPYVRERFHQDWSPDTTYSWQQDRAVCGHNLKIAWNLTRVAQYFTATDKPFADRLAKQADVLGRTMSRLAIDQVRGGVFDCVERRPTNGMPLQFAWWNTKDFWQQEQGILAYLILFGNTANPEYLDLARETMAFWNAFFLDHDTGNAYFRTDADGAPVLVGAGYRDETGHAKSGYHCFELAYLAHVYTSTYVTRRSFSLNFMPQRNCGQRSINVLPDFVAPDTLRVKRINVDGLDRETVDPNNFKIELSADDLGAHLIVELEPVVGGADV